MYSSNPRRPLAASPRVGCWRWWRRHAGLSLILWSALPLTGQAQPNTNDPSQPSAAGPNKPEPQSERQPNDQAAAGHREESPTDPPPTVPELLPPQILAGPAARYPESALTGGPLSGNEAVVLHLVLDPQGTVQTAALIQSPGPAFSSAALEAIKLWRFAPAQRAGQPIPASIHVSVPFQLPEFDLTTGAASHRAPPASPQAIPSAAHRSPEAASTSEPADTYGAEAQVALKALRTSERSASDVAVTREVLEAAPRSEGAEVLRSAPGLYIARGEGDAVGHKFMLRGFDAEHGQDLELSVGGLPLNQPSHLHGQGYADLGFLIGEVVEQLDVKEGVYDPAQGDFAVAGSIGVQLGVAQRGITLRSSYGSFNSFRQLVLWAPPAEARGTFAAVQLRGTDGFGENRFARSGSAIAQVHLGNGRFKYRAIGLVYGARADMAGVLRRSDVDAGKVDFYDVYDLPTAKAQNALALKTMVGFFGEYRGTAGDTGSFGLWLGLDDFRLQQNFTGYNQYSYRLLGVSGRGDLIEQTNHGTAIGLQASYRTATYQPTGWAKARLELGTQGRIDHITQAQHLIDAQRSQTWDERVDAAIQAVDLGLYGDLEARLSSYFVVRLGARADLLLYSVKDALQNQIPATRTQSFIEGYRRSAGGIAAGPRTSAELRLWPWLKLLAAYGEGYRSPQARTLDDGERAPFTKVRSADVGTRLDFAENLEIRLIGYYTRLSDDVVFEAQEGRLERVGASRRLGGVFYLKAQPWSFLIASTSLTYVDAELLDPPPPSISEPDPPFERGQNLPFVPPLVFRADLGSKHTLHTGLSDKPIRLRLGLGCTALSARPLPYGDFSAPFALIDGSLHLGLGRFEVGIEGFNLLDSQYAATEYNFVSYWDTSAPQSRLPQRHFSAGAPRTLMATLQVQL